MRKIGIYLSVLVLLLVSCKNDSEILRNMKPLEQYYKKYTVQQLVEKIMKDNDAKSVGIHFDLSNEIDQDTGICAFRATIIFNQGDKEGYGKLKEDCGLDTRNETLIKYQSDGTVIKANGDSPKFFGEMIFLFETLDLKLSDYKVTETEYDAQRGEERVYFDLPPEFQKQLFQTNFPLITDAYQGDRLLIMKLNGFVLQVRFSNGEQKYKYFETLSWETDSSEEPRLNFEKERGEQNG